MKHEKGSVILVVLVLLIIHSIYASLMLSNIVNKQKLLNIIKQEISSK